MSALDRLKKAEVKAAPGNRSVDVASAIQTAATQTKTEVCSSSYAVGQTIGQDISTAAAAAFVDGMNSELADLQEAVAIVKKYGASIRITKLIGSNPLKSMEKDGSKPPVLLWSSGEAH